MAKSTANTKKRDLTPSAIAVIDNLVFSKTEAWAYYRLDTEPFDFLASESKVASAHKIANAFASITGDKTEPIETHLIITSVPINVEAWATQVMKVTELWNRSPSFNRYMQEQIQFLEQQEYLKKEVFFGVCLGKRGALNIESLDVLEMGIKGVKETLGNWWSKAFGTLGEEISAEEENETRMKESEIFRTLANGNLRATRVNTEDILLLIKRQLYPTMPAPYLEVDHENRLGAGDIAYETASAIENKYRWLKVTQIIDGEEISAYRSCLSFTKFPRMQNFPYGTFPFLYLPNKLALPFTVFARLTLTPASVMKGIVERKKQVQKDEIENIQAGATNIGNTISGGMPIDAAQAIEDSQTLTATLEDDKSPWVTGSYRIVVETPTEEILRKYCSIVKQQYADLNITVTWSSGDQAELFLEQMPGDRKRVKSFEQITNLAFLATSGFRNANEVGDRVWSGEGSI